MAAPRTRARRDCASNVAEPLILSLPDELLMTILSRALDRATCVRDFFRIAFACRRFHTIAHHPLTLRGLPAAVVSPPLAAWTPLTHTFVPLAALSGHPEACYHLGMIKFYCTGQRSMGAALLTKAAAAGHSHALYALAVVLFNGSIGSKADRNPRAAVELCLRSAALGNIDALRELGHCLLDGYGIDRDDMRGRLLLLEARSREAAAAAAASEAAAATATAAVQDAAVAVGAGAGSVRPAASVGSCSCACCPCDSCYSAAVGESAQEGEKGEGMAREWGASIAAAPAVDMAISNSLAPVEPISVVHGWEGATEGEPVQEGGTGEETERVWGASAAVTPAVDMAVTDPVAPGESIAVVPGWEGAAQGGADLLDASSQLAPAGAVVPPERAWTLSAGVPAAAGLCWRGVQADRDHGCMQQASGHTPVAEPMGNTEQRLARRSDCAGWVAAAVASSEVSGVCPGQRLRGCAPSLTAASSFASLPASASARRSESTLSEATIATAVDTAADHALVVMGAAEGEEVETEVSHRSEWGWSMQECFSNGGHTEKGAGCAGSDGDNMQSGEEEVDDGEEVDDEEVDDKEEVDDEEEEEEEDQAVAAAMLAACGGGGSGVDHGAEHHFLGGSWAAVKVADGSQSDSSGGACAVQWHLVNQADPEQPANSADTLGCSHNQCPHPSCFCPRHGHRHPHLDHHCGVQPGKLATTNTFVCLGCHDNFNERHEFHRRMVAEPQHGHGPSCMGHCQPPTHLPQQFHPHLHLHHQQHHHHIHLHRQHHDHQHRQDHLHLHEQLGSHHHYNHHHHQQQQECMRHNHLVCGAMRAASSSTSCDPCAHELLHQPHTSHLSFPHDSGLPNPRSPSARLAPARDTKHNILLRQPATAAHAFLIDWWAARGHVPEGLSLSSSGAQNLAPAPAHGLSGAPQVACTDTSFDTLAAASRGCGSERWGPHEYPVSQLSLCSNAACGRRETRPKEFRCCAACREARYCSRACQARDWKLGHRLVCAMLVEALAEEQQRQQQDQDQLQQEQQLPQQEQ